MDDFATYGTLSHSGTRVARELRIHKNECASECAGVSVCVCVVTVSQQGKCKRFSGKRNACVDQKRTNELSTEFSTLSAADRRQLEARRGQGEGKGRVHPRTAANMRLELEINIKLTCSLHATH